MDVLNMNTHALPVQIKRADGSLDFITVQAKRRTTLPPGSVVDTNWLALASKVKTFEGPNSKTPLPTFVAPVAVQVQRISNAPAPSPVEAPAPSTSSTTDA